MSVQRLCGRDNLVRCRRDRDRAGPRASSLVGRHRVDVLQLGGFVADPRKASKRLNSGLRCRDLLKRTLVKEQRSAFKCAESLHFPDKY